MTEAFDRAVLDAAEHLVDTEEGRRVLAVAIRVARGRTAPAAFDRLADPPWWSRDVELPVR